MTENPQRRLLLRLCTGPMALVVAGCSPLEVVRNSLTFGSMGVMAYDLSSETELFRNHWKILNDYDVQHPSQATDKTRNELQNDLQKLTTKITEEIQRLERTTPALRQARYNQKAREYVGFKVVVTEDPRPRVRAVQDDKNPRVEISIGLLWRHLNETSRYMVSQKEKLSKEWSEQLTGDDLTNIATERASIPISLEYREALLFLLAHESVHIWLDPIETEDEALLREQEIRADALGLTIVSNVSYIVDVRRKNEGIEAAVLNWQSYSPRIIQSAVLYARSGPEYLFEVNQAVFNVKSTIYRPVEVRQSDAAAFMKKAVYGNLETPKDSYMFYLLNKIKVSR